MKRSITTIFRDFRAKVAHRPASVRPGDPGALCLSCGKPYPCPTVTGPTTEVH